ncbi:MAG: rhodanese-like domain-containing protein [Bosea sp. (in: a-proteobacteria)]
MNCRTFIAFALVASPAFAQTAPERATMSVREAHERATAKSVILVDIRRPDEWADTGVAEGAIKLDMTSPVFEARLASLRAENPGKPIAIICRTANRTRHVQEVLGKRGWTNIIDVRGGMLGDGRNKGWLDEGLPVGK